MNNYSCPMHPEVKSDKPIDCSKCGMKLVLNSKISTNVEPVNSYTPLIIIISLILLTALALSFNDLRSSAFTYQKTITYFMAGFFITFAGFKLMDLKGFAEGYSTYDLLAKNWFGYGYIYPFLELFFGMAMIINFQPKEVLISEIVLMSFSGLGVLLKILKKEKFQCSCLGTFLKVPLTKVTLIEDFGMAALAALLLLS